MKLKILKYKVKSLDGFLPKYTYEKRRRSAVLYRLGRPINRYGKFWLFKHYALVYQTGTAAVIGLALFIAGHQAVGAIGGYSAEAAIGQSNFNNNLPDGATASANGLYAPQGSVYDTTDQLLFVADTQNNRVMVYDTSSGVTDGMPASYVLGQPDFSTTTNLATPTSSSLYDPYGLAYDATDQLLFVADAQNNRVLVYDLSGGISNNMAATYVLGQPDFVSDSCSALATGLCGPDGVTYDATDQLLFVADSSNSRVMVYDLSGGLSNGMAASYELGQTDFTSNACNYGTPTDSSLCYPYYVAYDSDDDMLFATDGENNRVMVYDLSGGLSNGMAASYVLGQPDFSSSDCNTGGESNSTLCYAGPLFYDPTGDYLYESDINNNRMVIYSLSGGLSNGMASTYQDASTQAWGLTLDTSDQLLFESIGNSVVGYDLSGGPSDALTASYVLGQNSLSNMNLADDATINANGLDQAQNSAYDSTDDLLFVSDTSNNRILVYDTSSGITTNMSPSYVLGQPDFASNTCNNGGLSPTTLCTPKGLTYDPTTQTLFVADQGNDRVLAFDLSGGVSDDMAASNELGQTDMYSDGCYSNPATQTNLCGPQDVVYDSATSQLFIADTGNNRILDYDLSSGITDGMSASYELGQSDFTGSSCNSASLTGLCYPLGLAFDSADNVLFVADSNNSRIVGYDLSSGVSNDMNASYELGQPSFTDSSCNNGGVAANSICYPQGLAYSATNQQLFVSDSGNNRVLIFDTGSGITDNMDATDIIGQPNFNSAQYNIPSGQGGLYNPYGIAYDEADNVLFVNDLTNNRVLAFDLSNHLQITTGSLPDGTLSTSYDQTISASGGQSPYTYNIISGSLPNGLNLDSATGEITGTPSTSGLSSFTVEVTDDLGSTNTANLSINIDGGALSVTTTSLPAGDANTSYDQTIGVEGGYPSYTFAITSGNLPDGLSMDPSTGEITGTPTTVANYNFTVEVTDSLSNTTSENLSIDISPELLINTSTLVDGQTGTAYDETVSISGGTDPVNIYISSGSLPGGLNINSSTGEITGIPTAPGLSSFTIEVDDNAGVSVSQALTINVDLGPLYVIPNLSDGETTQYYDQTIDAEGGDEPYTFAITSGSLPDGLSMDPSTGEITGTPTTVANYNFTVEVTDSLSNTTSENLSINVYAPGGYLASGVIGQADFTSSGCNNAGMSASSLCDPEGTAIDTVNHRLFVADSGNNRVLVYDLDANNNVISTTATYVLGEPDFVTSNCITTQSGMCYPMGLDYDSVNNRLFVADEGNSRILVFDLSSGITNGMNASYVLGEPDFVTGNCTTSQNGLCYSEGLTYDATSNQLFIADSNNSRVISYDVNPADIQNYENANAVLGQGNNYTTDNDADTQTGMCYPNGVAIDSQDHLLYVADPCNQRVTVYQLNSSDQITTDSALYVLGQPNFTTENDDVSASGMDCPTAVAYDSTQKKLFVTDACDYRVTVFDTASLSTDMAATAVIGQPSFGLDYPGSSQSGFDVDYPSSTAYDPVTGELYIPDDNGRVLSFDLAHITSSSLASGTVGTSYSQTVTEAGSQGTVSYSVNSGSLPPGLSLNSSSGILSGNPTTAGTYGFTVGVSDDNGVIGNFTNSQSYTVDIVAAASGGGGGSNTNKKTVTKTTVVTSPTTTAPLVTTTTVLNTSTSYFNQVGVTLAAVVPGDVQLFCLTSDQQVTVTSNGTPSEADSTCTAPSSDTNSTSSPIELHSITINSINTANNTVTFTVASTPQTITLAVGQSKDISVDQNGVNDIEVSLNSITPANGSTPAQANLTYTNLLIPTTPASTTTTTPTPSVSTLKPKTKSDTTAKIVAIILGIVIVASIIVAAVLVVRRLKDRSDKIPTGQIGFGFHS